MKVTQSIFKAYDIRGAVGTELTEEVAEAIGRATADWLPRAGDVAVGYDMRPDSQSLAAAVRAGVTGQGRNVVDVGQVTSDMSYFAVGLLDLAGSIMVTASHNPGKDNGVKIYRDEVRPVGLDNGLDEIRDAVADGKLKPEAGQPGRVIKKNIVHDWVKHCLTFETTPIKPFRIAIDAGNGMASVILPELQKQLPLKVTEMYYELDGTFPNHEANPMKPANLRDLAEMVKREKLDFGIAFDGDGDRTAFVDDLGRPVDGSYLIAIMAKHFLELFPGAEIIHDVRTSRGTQELIQEWGGKTFRVKAGRVEIARVARERNSPFAAETTGHMYFRDNYFADAGMITAVVAMTALSESGEKLSELVDKYRRYAMDPEANFRVKDPEAVIERLAEHYGDGEKDRIDGLSVYYPDWWFNLRPSNTEPLVRLNAEARDEEMLADKKAELVKLIGGEPE